MKIELNKMTKAELIKIINQSADDNVALDDAMREIAKNSDKKAIEIAKVAGKIAWFDDLMEITSRSEGFDKLNDTQTSARLIQNQRVLKYAFKNVFIQD